MIQKWFEGIKKGDISKYVSPLAIVVLTILFSMLNGNFLKEQNIGDLFNNMTPLLTVSLGATFVLLIGSMDLSVGSIVSCATVLVALCIPKMGAFSFIIAILFGGLAGALNGLVFTYFKIPSFIVTLGSMGLWQSVAYLLAPAAVGIQKADWGVINWGKVSFSVFSIPFVIAIALVIGVYCFLKNSRTGKRIYAVGANEIAARLAGVHVSRVKFSAFVYSGLFCGIASIFAIVKFRSGSPIVGENYTMLSIASVCLGGIPLTGGKGNSFGTLLGVLLVMIIQNGMTMISVDGYWQYIVFGILIILSMYITTDRSDSRLTVK